MQIPASPHPYCHADAVKTEMHNGPVPIARNVRFDIRRFRVRVDAWGSVDVNTVGNYLGDTRFDVRDTGIESGVFVITIGINADGGGGG